MSVDYSNFSPQKQAYFNMPMTFQSVGETSISYNYSSNNRSLNYRKTGESSWTPFSSNGMSVSLSDGQKLQLSGNSDYNFSESWSNRNRFVFSGSGKLKLYGNISSLFNPNSVTSATQIKLSDFMNFYSSGNNVLIDASNLIMLNPPQTYSGAFGYNKALTATPALFAQTIIQNGCQHMFNYSSNVLKAGPVFATTLGSNALTELYLGCTTLSCIEVLFTSWGACSNWMNGVQTNGGIFIKPQSLSLTRGKDAIPNNWLVLNRKQDNTLQYAQDYGNYVSGDLYTDEDPYVEYYGTQEPTPQPEYTGVVFKSTGNTTVSLNKVGNPNETTIQYTTDGITWANVTGSINLTDGDLVAFSGNAKFSKNIQNRYNFSTTGEGTLVLSGQLMSLVSGETIEDQYEFNSLFSGCTNIVDASNFSLSSTTLNDFCYSNMFKDCTGLISSPSALPASTLYPWCYQGMFAGCVNLSSTLSCLPAMDLAKYCYYAMYYNCKKLVTPPGLPAYDLDDFCYTSMFYGCESLGYNENNFSIQGANLVEGSCANMFVDCKNLHNFGIYAGNWDNTPNTSAHCNATNIWVHNVYSTGFFSKIQELAVQRGENKIPQNWNIGYDIPLIFKSTGSTTVVLSAVGAPDTSKFRYTKNWGEVLDYTTGTTIQLSDGDILTFRGDRPYLSKDDSNYYQFITSGDGTLALSGKLASMSRNTITQFVYEKLFAGTTNITDASNLIMPSKTAQNSFRSMFYNSSLRTPPALPATTLTPSCYYCMFQNCAQLQYAPELSATTLADSCYYGMFFSTNLTAAPSLPATTLANGCYYGMFQKCSGLVQAPDLPATTLTPSCYYQMFTGCNSLSSISAKFTDWNDTNDATKYWVSGISTDGFFYSPDALSTARGNSYIPTSWFKIQKPSLMFTGLKNSNSIAVNAGAGSPSVDLKYKKGDNNWTSYSLGTIISINSGETIAFSGNNSNFNQGESKYCNFVMTGSFKANGTIQSLLNYSNSCTDNCYYKLFQNCTSLLTAPTLSTTTLAEQCYMGMFKGCTNLSTAPQLPASTLYFNCYASMFSGCTSLTSAPQLPAKTLAAQCYYSMFSRCTSLTSAPELPATGLAYASYTQMFKGCTNLNNINVSITSWETSWHTIDWVDGVAANGTFTKPTALAEIYGTSNIPDGWTVINK